MLNLREASRLRHGTTRASVSLFGKAEDQEVLPRQEVVVGLEAIARLLHIALDDLAFHPVLAGGPPAALLVLDDGYASSATEIGAQPREIARRILDMVVGVGEEDEVDPAVGQQRSSYWPRMTSTLVRTSWATRSSR